MLIPDVLRIDLALPATDVGVATNGLQNGRRFGDDVIDILLRLSRQLADVKFPTGSGVPGSGALGTRQALDCSVLPACPDRRVLAVLQGTDFIRSDDDARRSRASAATIGPSGRTSPSSASRIRCRATTRRLRVRWGSLRSSDGVDRDGTRR